MTAGTKPGYEIGRDERGLTKREREVLTLLVEGKNGPQIGEALGITKQRVKQIMAALEKKGRLTKTDHSYAVTVPR